MNTTHGQQTGNGQRANSSHPAPCAKTHDPLHAPPTTTILNAVQHVRAYAHHTGQNRHTRQFETADGTMTIDYHAGQHLKITFTGDGPERTYTRPHDWGTE